MKVRSLVLFAAALTLAAGAALVARILMRPPPPVTIVKEAAPPPAPSAQVLVAACEPHDTPCQIVPGEFIGPRLAWRDVTAGAPVDALAYVALTEVERQRIEREVAAATPRRTLSGGGAVRRDALVRSGEPGFLAAVLRPDMRAVSVPTSAVASNMGLVSAGDRVDVILNLQRDTLEPVRAGVPNSLFSALASQTIVRDVRVLALNGSPSGIAPTPATAPAGKADADADPVPAPAAPAHVYYESITLEVTPTDAERLALAREVGTLQMALRSVQAVSPAVPEDASHVTRIGDATAIFPPLPSLASPPIPSQPVDLYRGDRLEQRFFAPRSH